MKNENLLKEELQITLKSQGEELILDTFEKEYKETGTEQKNKKNHTKMLSQKATNNLQPRITRLQNHRSLLQRL